MRKVIHPHASVKLELLLLMYMDSLIVLAKPCPVLIETFFFKKKHFFKNINVSKSDISNGNWYLFSCHSYFFFKLNTYQKCFPPRISFCSYFTHQFSNGISKNLCKTYYYINSLWMPKRIGRDLGHFVLISQAG